MSGSFSLLTLSFYLILHNVCSWTVREPLKQTMNKDGSISVTCMPEETHVDWKFEAKLKMNNSYICEVYDKKLKKPNCTYEQNGKNFTFTWMHPTLIHKSVFSCEFTRILPVPLQTKEGPTVSLFQGCFNSMASINLQSCSCNETNKIDFKPEDTLPEHTYQLLICVLLIVVVMLFLYSIILTAVYIRVKMSKQDSSDTLIYMPMQRNIKPRVPDNTEYVDMREVQKHGGSHKDMNHNSHLIRNF